MVSPPALTADKTLSFLALRIIVRGPGQYFSVIFRTFGLLILAYFLTCAISEVSIKKGLFFSLFLILKTLSTEDVLSIRQQIPITVSVGKSPIFPSFKDLTILFLSLMFANSNFSFIFIFINKFYINSLFRK